MLKLNNINKSFKLKQVLKDIELEFERGEIVFVLGQSGCGKTTLLNIIGGLESADSGSISFGDRKVTHNDSEYKRKDVAFVFQEHNLVAGLTVGENIALANSGLGDEWIESNANRYNINPKQKVEYLSGGESQRVALLRCLYKEASIILADEPTGSLDNKNRDKVFQDICSLRGKDKIVIVVSHDEDSANKYADRIIRLDNGSVLSDDKIDRSQEVERDTYNNIASGGNIGQASSNVVVKNNSNTAIKRKGRIWGDYVLTKNAISKHWVRMLGIVILLSFSLSFVAQSWAIRYNQHGLKSELIKQFQLNMIDVKGRDIDTNSITQISNVGGVQQYYMDRGSIEVDPSIHQSPKIYGGYGLYFSRTLDRDVIINSTTNRPNVRGGVIEQVDTNNDFWHNRTMSNDIVGRYIEDWNDIIIGLSLAKMLFDDIDYAIGSDLYVLPKAVGDNELESFPFDSELKAKIVGINYSEIGVSYVSDWIVDRESETKLAYYAREGHHATFIGSSFLSEVYKLDNDIGDDVLFTQVYLKDHKKYAHTTNDILKVNGVKRAVSTYKLFSDSLFRRFDSGGLDPFEQMLLSAIVLAAILMTVVLIFIAISNKQRRYEMVVLKSLGYSRWRMLVLFCYDFLFVSLVAFLISFVWDILFISFFKKIFEGVEFLHMTSHFWTSVMVLLVLLSIIALGALWLTSNTIFGKVSKGLKATKQ